MTTPTPVTDVLRYLDLSAKGYVRLSAIFETIEREGGGDRRLTALAGAGRYIADDAGNLADCWETEIEEYGIRTD